MIEAYKIAVNMTLTGDAHKKMMDFSKLVEKTTRDVELFLRALRGMNSTFSNFGRDVRVGMQEMRGFDHTLNNVGRDATRVRTQVDSLRNSIRSLNATGGRGSLGRGGILGAGLIGTVARRYLAPATIGYEAYRLGKSSFESDVEFEKKIGQLTARGYTASQIRDVRNFVSSQNIPGVSSNDMVDAFVDALMATQSQSQAKFLAPTLAKGAAYATGTYGGMSHKQQQDLVRFAEFRGHGDSAKIKEQLELGFQMMALSGGSIKPSELRGMAKYGGGAVSGLSNQALLGLEPVLQMRGGSSTGTALQTLNLALIAGQMSTARGRSLTSLGMFDTGAIKYDASGRTLGNKFGSFKYAKELQTDPFSFLMQRYIPALAKKGITDPKEVEQRIQYDFSRTASQILILMYENSNKILRTLVQSGQLGKGDYLYSQFLKTPSGAQMRFEKSWDKFRTALGKFEEPQVIAGLNILSSVLDKISWGLEKLSGGTNLGQMISGTVTKNDFSWANPKREMKGDVILDGKKMGKWISDKLAGNSMTIDGTQATNIGYHGAPNAANYLGGSLSI